MTPVLREGINGLVTSLIQVGSSEHDTRFTGKIMSLCWRKYFKNLHCVPTAGQTLPEAIGSWSARAGAWGDGK